MGHHLVIPNCLADPLERLKRFVRIEQGLRRVLVRYGLSTEHLKAIPEPIPRPHRVHHPECVRLIPLGRREFLGCRHVVVMCPFFIWILDSSLIKQVFVIPSEHDVHIFRHSKTNLARQHKVTPLPFVEVFEVLGLVVTLDQRLDVKDLTTICVLGDVVRP